MQIGFKKNLSYFCDFLLLSEDTKLEIYPVSIIGYNMLGLIFSMDNIIMQINIEPGHSAVCAEAVI